jgi:heme exporter protein C
MNSARATLATVFWGATALLFAVALGTVLLYVPVEETMGPVQKIFYLHLPAAIDMFLAALVVFIGSLGYLVSRRERWDRLALAGAQVTVVYCTVVLATGMTWARFAWGQWWTWSPRLTFSLILWLLYVSYLVIRPSIDSPAKRARVCAVYGVVAFLDVPLVYLSVKLLPDIHPASVTLAPEMKRTLLICLVPMTLLCIGLIRVLSGMGARRAREPGASPARPTAPLAGAQPR